MKSAITLSLLLLSAPLAAAQVVKAVPAEFLGYWGSSPKCGADADDLALRIERRKISYYESSGPLKAIVVHKPREIALIAELSGEGQTWLATAQFTLSPRGDKLIDDTTVPGRKTVRYRCHPSSGTRSNNSFNPMPLRGTG